MVVGKLTLVRAEQIRNKGLKQVGDSRSLALTDSDRDSDREGRRGYLAPHDYGSVALQSLRGASALLSGRQSVEQVVTQDDDWPRHRIPSGARALSRSLSLYLSLSLCVCVRARAHVCAACL